MHTAPILVHAVRQALQRRASEADFDRQKFGTGCVLTKDIAWHCPAGSASDRMSINGRSANAGARGLEACQEAAGAGRADFSILTGQEGLDSGRVRYDTGSIFSQEARNRG